MKLCERCNRKLKSQKSIEDGMGRSCKKKAKAEAADATFEKLQITIFDIIDFNGGGEIDAGIVYTRS